MVFFIADVPRSYPENIYFQNTPSDPNGKRKLLFNVLLALAEKNKEVGYCQVSDLPIKYRELKMSDLPIENMEI